DGHYVSLLTYGTGADPKLTLWDLHTRRRRFPDQTPATTYPSVSISPDNTLIALSGGPEANAEVRSAVDGHVLTRIKGLPIPPIVEYHNNTSAVRFLGDGSLAIGSQSGVVRIVDPHTGREVRRITGPEQTSEAA